MDLIGVWDETHPLFFAFIEPFMACMVYWYISLEKEPKMGLFTPILRVSMMICTIDISIKTYVIQKILLKYQKLKKNQFRKEYI
jgi:hypothetical protein